MKSRALLIYQILVGLSDTCTGFLLMFAPALTLRLMRIHSPEDALPWLSFVGAFVLSVGLTCLYGAFLVKEPSSLPKLEVVWLVTGMTRGVIAVFVALKIVTGGLESNWATVAITDGVLACLQGFGLRRGWLANALG